jgi:putative FmdB family regulatory protein
MPIFDIKCTQCGLITRDVFLTKEGNGFTCKCGAKDKFKKLPSRVAVHFKGKGWTEKG